MPSYQVRTTPPLVHAPRQDYDQRLKDQKQKLVASMDVILSLLKDRGVSKASIDALRNDLQKEQYKAVLQRCQQYMMCIITKRSDNCESILLISGWDSLVRLNTLRYRRALKLVQNIKLRKCMGDFRKANFDLQMLAEATSASQLGLLKANAWRKCLENKSSTRRSLSI